MHLSQSIKRIVILSDNQKLAKTLALNLEVESAWQVDQWVLDTSNHPTDLNGNLSLIVIALNSPIGEPIMALAKASLTHYIGRVPLLIISDRPFPEDLEAQISHLDFPSSSEGFYGKVREILAA